MTDEQIAEVAHEVNRVCCASHGDLSQVPWADAPAWQKESAEAGVRMHRERPEATPADSHVSWCAHKVADGWTWGPVKDVALKQHPCLVPYNDLPADQRVKDDFYCAVVKTLLRQDSAKAPPPPPAGTVPGEVYAREECVFQYCPSPEDCTLADACVTPAAGHGLVR